MKEADKQQERRRMGRILEEFASVASVPPARAEIERAIDAIQARDLARWDFSQHGWHRGERCMGDRYWGEEDARRIAEAEAGAGRTLWPDDNEWPLSP